VAQETRSRLSQALLSPSGKLTFSPEIFIPEPSDPTAILLQTNAIQTLSERIRTCKANSVFIQGSLSALKTFTSEQESARGGFPGPVPVVYCGTGNSESNDYDLEAVAESGPDGVLVRVCSGKEVGSLEDIISDETWVKLYQEALDKGIQPIPEITVGLNVAASWGEEEVSGMVEKLTEAADGKEPVCILLTVNAEENGDDDHEADNEAEEPATLPQVPKALGKRIPILGSICAQAGDNRLGGSSALLKDAGFTGALLRKECLPGMRIQLDLGIVGQFWSACINDLKSVKSKSFSFRSKNNMEKSAMTKWANYQNSVIESGALGDPEDSYSLVDEAAGEYKGFA